MFATATGIQPVQHLEPETSHTEPFRLVLTTRGMAAEVILLVAGLHGMLGVVELLSRGGSPSVEEKASAHAVAADSLRWRSASG